MYQFVSPLKPANFVVVVILKVHVPLRKVSFPFVEGAAHWAIFRRRIGDFLSGSNRVKSGQNLSGHQLADFLSADKNLHLWASVG